MLTERGRYGIKGSGGVHYRYLSYILMDIKTLIIYCISNLPVNLI
jgi:hypothetical protein